MEGMELIAFNIISNVGTAKSLVMEALYAAREGLYEEAEAKLKESRQFLLVGHNAHLELIQEEALGKQLTFSLIIMHAEDQMMSVETINDLVIEMIRMYKDINQLKAVIHTDSFGK
ncbi:PTS lactose/cellobiose transporter subunit IIA [Peribacillus psychrosaccharolyticus]|uniref:PTS lactose/cellobiose transporter subunit IIA n=1 Tax=Peribacillus psychrosaccharolyticus TaxID=1407 RepID=A0A974S1A3_PERPY|nr:PTS lactose/cellobiose transporter subunit IIA [Peribacillus psychrosaccharolyticus]MEC2054085.1 PTS lactose/cellobiose transporter subunit IIA [Peribacillus psychrosaccharolyticus]MED3742295.1 PTS lactose/cellobiose transporter subunit IIA [Peribacillus psychrosaccharolyticus]QQT01273.1 PTS lactose/cellobiose transporter subunit IIA [Peribacillus psychrosaccharolyticus]